MRSMQKVSDIYAQANHRQSLVFLLLLPALLLLAIPVSADMVNINRANAAALEQNLDGIGPVKAQTIVDYRKKNGPFKSTDELAKVPGIGPEILKKNNKNLSTTRGLVKADKSRMKKASARSENKLKADSTSVKEKTSKKTKKEKKSKKSASARQKSKDKMVSKGKKTKQQLKTSKHQKSKK